MERGSWKKITGCPSPDYNVVRLVALSPRETQRGIPEFELGYQILMAVVSESRPKKEAFLHSSPLREMVKLANNLPLELVSGRGPSTSFLLSSLPPA